MKAKATRGARAFLPPLQRRLGGMMAAVALLLPGCKPPESAKEGPVVLYCSVDEQFAREVIGRYQDATGRSVELVTDSEAGKTTGLVKRLRLERDRPRADVFWSSEQSQMVLLAREGLLAPYVSSSAASIPDQFKDAQHRWTGFALRARVLAYDPSHTQEEDVPKRWEELAGPDIADRLSMANPLFGTTRGQMAAMYALWGEQRFRVYLQGLVDGGVRLADGNSAAVRQMIAGGVDYAMTDSDDVFVAKARGMAVAMTFPDMGDGGTMLIPNTVALIAGTAHPFDARKLIDFILSETVEEMLARSESHNYPVRAALRKKLGMELPPASKVGFEEIADAMDPAIAACREILFK